MTPASHRRPVHTRCAALLLACALAACGRGDDVAAARWQTVTDTIGDTIVVRTVGARDSAALLTLVPEVRIGEMDGPDEYTFGRVGALRAAPQGGVYVWDGVLKTLRQYDDSGTFVRQIARRGSGPGEYQEVNDLALLPDGRLILWDPRNGRVNVYDSTGTPLESWRTMNSLFTSPPALWVDSTGGVYMRDWLNELKSDRPGDEPPMALVRVGPEGTPVDTLLPPVPDMPNATLVASRGGGTSYYDVPFMPDALWAFTPAGDFVTARGDRYALLVHRRGLPLLRIERDAEPVPVQPDEADDRRASATAGLRMTDPSWRWNGPDIPGVKPLIRGITVDADGRIWVQRSQPGERIPEVELAEMRAEAARSGGPNAIPPRTWREPIAYDVFTPTGEFLGHLPVPPRTSLLYMSGGTVWASVRDSLDVPTVTRFRVEPAAGLRDAGWSVAR